MEINTVLICTNIEPLVGNDVAPPLELGKHYPVLNIIQDRKGNDHYDVGLVSKFNYITSFETGEELKDGHKIHWCHPSRFEIKDAITIYV